MYRVLSYLFGTLNSFLFALALLLSIIGVGGVEGSAPVIGSSVIAVALTLFYWQYRLLKQDMRRRRLR